MKLCHSQCLAVIERRVMPTLRDVNDLTDLLLTRIEHWCDQFCAASEIDRLHALQSAKTTIYASTQSMCVHLCAYVCYTLYARVVCLLHGVCVHVCIYACVHICIYACVHVCVHACVHVCMSWPVDEHVHRCMCCELCCAVLCVCACVWSHYKARPCRYGDTSVG